MLFAVFYHDIIYKVSRNDNEEKSAELAKERLTQVAYPASSVEMCMTMIRATKHHQRSDDPDVNLFTDADLCILGQEPKVYYQYALQIRKEYSIYPDFLYKPGRKKVLQHFLTMSRIFKSHYFFDKYEQQAKANLEEELKQL
jgi:predicted metal-dependent HD superfamily phosphohydrolase